MSNLVLNRRAVLAGAGAVLVAQSCNVHAAPFSKLLRPDAMRADIAVLRRAYEALHPGLLRYNTPRQIEAGFAALNELAAAPMSLSAFYIELSRFLSTIRCGHTYANFYNQRAAVAEALFAAPDRLPFNFLWLENDMVVTADPFQTGIKAGSRILSIDGRHVGEILAALMPLVRADGHNDAKRRRLISVQSEDRYETFDIFFSLLFGRERYQLLIEEPTGHRRNALVPAISLAQRRGAMHAGSDPSGDAPIWTIQRRDGAAVLSMPNWALYDSKWDWQAWLDNAIDELIVDRVPRLVVDLRGNEGGQDCGNALAARLLTKEVPFEEVRRLVRYRSIPDDLRPHLDTWDRSFDHLGEGASAFDDRFYQLDTKGEEIGPVQPKGRRYAGDVRVLIGPQNSSATFQFADFVRRTGIATLVGQNTGGNRRGINGGCFYFLRLPETGLEADLPLVGRFPKSPQPDRGVTPQRIVPISAADIANGYDRQLAVALSSN